MRILKEHIRRYPQMRPTDVIKLLYQRTFGGEHIAPDLAHVRAYLTREYETVPQTADCPRIEPIGGGISRVYLNGLPRASLDTFARLFVRGASIRRGDADRMTASLAEVSEAAKRGETPFSAAEWESAVAEWRSAGCPSVHHSAEYRAAYKPAYRVIPAAFVPYLPLLFAIDTRMAAGKRTVLALDGMCGSGKSTLADLLSDLYGAAVVRMDDFFLPPDLRTPERLAEAGGNIHYERFCEEVSPYLGTGAPFSYRAFDCSRMALGERVAVPVRALTVVEGSYALHPALRARYDLTAYVACTAEEQAARLQNRCANEALYARFVNEWIPMETAYARAFSVRECADFGIDTTNSDWEENGYEREKKAPRRRD